MSNIYPIYKAIQRLEENLKQAEKEVEDEINLSAKREKLKYDEEEPEEKFNVTQFLPRF